MLEMMDVCDQEMSVNPPTQQDVEDADKLKPAAAQVYSI